MTNNSYFVPVADIKAIVESGGVEHARLCIDEMAGQMGSDACHAQWVELDRIEQAIWADNMGAA